MSKREDQGYFGFFDTKVLRPSTERIIIDNCIDGVRPVEVYTPQAVSVDAAAKSDLLRLSFMGRLAWDKDWKRNPEDFVRHIIKMKHESVIEHLSFSFLILCDRACYDDQTEVLTKDGWKLFKDTAQTDEFACLDDEGKLFYSHQEGDMVSKPWDGDLLAFESTSIDFMVTPNHNMWVYDHQKRSDESRAWKFIHAQDMKNARYKFQKSAEWYADDVTVSIPAHPTKFNQYPALDLDADRVCDLFELLGLWITDGSYKNGTAHGSGSCIVISQTKFDVVHRIDELCASLGFNISWDGRNARIDNGRLKAFVEDLLGTGAKTFTAHVPDLIKSSSFRQISAFIRGVIAGDGTTGKTGHTDVYTASRAFADDLQELFMKAGVSANIRLVRQSERVWPSGHVSPPSSIYVVTVHGDRRSEHLLDRRCAKSFGEPVQYQGNVYCVTVPGHRLYVRRNGKAAWCGNTSHEIVRHRIASYTQMSQRYISYSDWTKPAPICLPEIIASKDGLRPLTDEEEAFFVEHAIESFAHYRIGVNFQGIRPEQARLVLPNECATIIGMTINARSLRNFLRLRMAGSAYPQIRAVANDIFDSVKECGLGVLVEEFQDLQNAFDTRNLVDNRVMVTEEEDNG